MSGDTPAIVPRHQWTHDGTEVLILKCVDAHGQSHGGFQWPLTVGATVEAPDWNAAPSCGGGLHGWPWGFSIGDGKEPDWSATWLVFGAAPADVVDLDGKCKARRGVVHVVGTWVDATSYVLAGQMAWIHHAASGAASATGASGAASATGASGAASATGDASLAGVTGGDGRAQCGPYGCLALSWWNNPAQRMEMRCARVGCGDGSDGLLKALTWYRLDVAGDFVEATA